MSGINKAILVGNIGKDVDVKFMQNGTAMTSFSVATTESWIDKEQAKKRVGLNGTILAYLARLLSILTNMLGKVLKSM